MGSAIGSDGSTDLEAQGREIVERLGGEWQRRGGMCRCPAHDDQTPSLSIRPGERRLLFHCFAGCGAGSVIRALSALQLIGPEVRAGHAGPASSPADPERRNRGAASRLWTAAHPTQRSPAEAYLRGRGLTLDVSDLRYHPHTPYGRAAQAVFHPALLCGPGRQRAHCGA